MNKNIYQRTRKKRRTERDNVDRTRTKIRVKPNNDDKIDKAKSRNKLTKPETGKKIKYYEQ